jgi:hypothetical protein
MSKPISKLRRAAWTACVTAAGLNASQVSAHHSFAMYDSSKLLSVAGTVKEFQWTNPHVILWLVKDGESGQESELWTVELPTSTGNLSRMDWSKHSLAPGDRVTVEMNPLRDGHHGGSFKKVTIQATGKVLTASPPSSAGTPSTPDAGAAVPGPSAAVATATPPEGAPVVQPVSTNTSHGGCACIEPSSRARSVAPLLSLLASIGWGLGRRRRQQP